MRCLRSTGAGAPGEKTPSTWILKWSENSCRVFAAAHSGHFDHSSKKAFCNWLNNNLKSLFYSPSVFHLFLRDTSLPCMPLSKWERFYSFISKTSLAPSMECNNYVQTTSLSMNFKCIIYLLTFSLNNTSTLKASERHHKYSKRRQQESILVFNFWLDVPRRLSFFKVPQTVSHVCRYVYMDVL